MEKRFWQKFYDYSVPTTIRYPKYPIQQMVHVSASLYPKKAATNLYGSEMTFAQLRNRMVRMANALARLGIKKGDRIGIALPNCPQYVISYYATFSVGAIVVNMNPMYTYDELKFMVENTGMETLITFDAVLPMVRTLAKDTALKRVIVTKVTDMVEGSATSTFKSLELEEGWHHFSELIEASSDTSIPRIAFSPEDPALIQFTGGTTGLPKGALLTHGNIVAATFQGSLWGSPIVAGLPQEQRAVIGIIPYFHIYGNLCCINWAILNGATQIILPRFDIDELLETITRFEQITYLPAVPTMITAIANHPKAAQLNLGEHIKLIASGGAPMPTELINKIRDMGIAFGEGWGMSETTSSGISNPVLANKIGSIGIPLMDNDLRLVDVENGVEDVKPGEPGEIVIKGPTVMSGYWNNPQETADQLKEGWLHTGDVGQMDGDGYIYIVDRKKDMIIAGGFNIYPREVDEVLYQHPKVAEAVAVGVPDAYRGETVKAYIVLKQGETATEKDVIDFCKKKLAPYKVPKLIEFRDAIPKSAVGKILRKMLREEELAKVKK